MTKMKSNKSIVASYLVASVLAAAVFSSCKKTDNPNHLPSVNTADYAGKIDGFDSSGQILPNNLVAYWSFDNTNAENKTGFTPTQTAGNSFVSGGVRGSALSLTNGYLYYAKQFPQFKTDSMKSWSISVWLKILNNGSKRTMVLQLARPGMFTGNINFYLNTQSYPASNTTTLRIQPVFATVGGGTQDNLNNVLDQTNLNDWVHLVLTYDSNTGVFNNWMNAVKVGNFPNRGTGNSLYKAWEPSELIIGSNYNGIPGMTVSTDVSIAPMTGQMDELRIYNTPLPDAQIRALYNLGKANK